MSDPVNQAVCATLAYLAKATREDLRPDDAQRRLRAVEVDHPQVRMQLLWEVEAYDNSVHYDVLVRPNNGDIISISVCRDQTLPWPLRGVGRWTEANLVQVNGRMLTMEDAVGFLDILWNQAPIMERMIDACIIREELERNPIVISDEELQAGVDGLRRTHRLYSAEGTERWMRQRGMTHEQLERLVAGNLTCAHLRRRIAADQIASYFASHRSQFDLAHIARIELPDSARAARLHARVTKGTIAFASAMQEEFVSNDSRVRCDFISLRRRDVSSEFEERLFEAGPGDVVGPLRVGSSHVVGSLLTLRPACDDVATHSAVEQVLFDLWLTERRRQATIAWHWGRAPGPI